MRHIDEDEEIVEVGMPTIHGMADDGEHGCPLLG
jgi:hypothetical protein